MIDWFFNRRRLNRLCYDKKLFKSTALKFNRDYYIRQVNKIRQSIMDGNLEDVKERGRVFVQHGLIPPETLSGCEKIIKDLQEWHG